MTVLCLGASGVKVATIFAAPAGKPYPTQKSLDSMMSTIDHIRIIDAGMENGKAMEGKQLLDTKKPDDIQSIRSLLMIREDNSAFGYCMCLGGPTIEFYSNYRLVATIGLHHGESIRWDKWKCDVLLKDNEKFLAWLAINNVTKPKQEYEDTLRRQTERENRYWKWFSAMPQCLRSRWKEIDWHVPGEPTKKTIEDLWSIASAAYPDQNDLILALTGWYGTGDWFSSQPYERAPEELLLRMDTQKIVKSIMGSKLSYSQMEGAARYLSGWTIEERKPQDKAFIPQELRQKILAHVKQQRNKDKIARVQNYLFK